MIFGENNFLIEISAYLIRKFLFYQYYTSLIILCHINSTMLFSLIVKYLNIITIWICINQILTGIILKYFGVA